MVRTTRQNQQKRTNDLLMRLLEVSYAVSRKYGDGIPQDEDFLQINELLDKICELVSVDEILNESDEDIKFEALESDRRMFDHKDLRHVLKSRVKTHDRYANTGAPMLYPITYIRMLYKEAGKQKEFEKIVDQIVDGIQFYTNDGTISMPEIDLLTLENGKVIITTKDGCKLTLRDHTDNRVMKATRMRNVTIDHYPQISKQLVGMAQKGAVKELEKISYHLCHHKPYGNRGDYHKAVKEKIKEGIPFEIDFEELKNEILSLNKDLRMLHSSKNSPDGHNSKPQNKNQR